MLVILLTLYVLRYLARKRSRFRLRMAGLRVFGDAAHVLHELQDAVRRQLMVEHIDMAYRARFLVHPTGLGDLERLDGEYNVVYR